MIESDRDVALDGFTLRARRLRHPTADAALDAETVDAAHERPTLVFLHDSLGCIETWRDFPRRLAECTGLDALIFDRRGYGKSSPFGPAPRDVRYLENDANVALELLESVGVADAILVGHSDGGSIALVAAARAPERIRAVVTEGAHVFVEDITLAGIREARATLASTNLRERLARYHGDRTDAMTSAWIDTWLSPGFRNWNIEAYLPSIECPVLVLQGEDDEYGTAAQVDAIVRGVGPLARGRMLPGVAHTPHREAADAVLEIAAGFVQEVMAVT